MRILLIILGVLAAAYVVTMWIIPAICVGVLIVLEWIERMFQKNQ